MTLHEDLLGYTDRPDVKAGETVNLSVHSARGDYELQLVQLVQGDRSPSGPGYLEREVEAACNGVHHGRVQTGQIGSYAIIDDHEAFAQLTSFTIGMLVYPTCFTEGGTHLLFARRDPDMSKGGAFGIDGSGHLCAFSGQNKILTGPRIRLRRWTRIWCRFQAELGRITLAAVPVHPLASEKVCASSEGPASFDPAPFGCPVTLAAGLNSNGSVDHYDGKLEDVLVYAEALPDDALIKLDAPQITPVAHWDFGDDVASDRLRDRGPLRATGRLVQGPLRATPGHNWTRRETDFRLAPDEFRACHFHRDDLLDCGWTSDIAYSIPRDLPSGIYAFRLRCGELEDRVPFFVTPASNKVRADIALVMPTFSYLAYGNERISEGVDFVAAGMTDREPEYGPADEILRKHPEFGLSMYDHRHDGSGVVFASWRRPLLNLRPDYRWWLSGSPQYLGCDLFIAHWLEHLGKRFDVITDHDISRNGYAELGHYQVVITSSHPEYMDYTMMSAFGEYTRKGGRLMYLGGNGFYWVTSLLPDKPYAIEVRRGFAGTRAWESAPGEEYHASTGERGGLWRHRGLPPNEIVGIGFSAQGWSKHAAALVRTPASHAEDVAWIFDGVASDQFGGFGLIMDSAVADELDRADIFKGTPEDAVVLASSGNHGPFYLQVHEDALFSHRGLSGEVNPDVRADVTFLPVHGGGAVFSVGSKSWVGSLPHRDFKNDIETVTRNVLTRFLDPTPFLPENAS